MKTRRDIFWIKFYKKVVWMQKNKRKLKFFSNYSDF